MAYINKIVVNGQEVNANQLEGILDKDGNARFIEGDITPKTISGYTFNYSKWALSGTHLMLVMAGVIASGTAISGGVVLASVTLPQWIKNKIYPNAIEGIIAKSYLNTWKTGSAIGSNYASALQKVDDNYNIVFWTESSVTLDADTAFRLQIDLIIDNASA